MQFSKTIQMIIFRDIISYLIPGVLSLLSLGLFNFDANGSFANWYRHIQLVVGNKWTFIILVGIAYAIGYTISAFIYEIWSYVPKRTSGNLNSIENSVIDQLKPMFGDIKKMPSYNADKLYCINQLCLTYIEHYDQEFYSSKYERNLMLRNFELGLAGTFIIWSVVIVFTLEGYFKLMAFLPLIASLYLFFITSYQINQEITDLIHSKFYIINQISSNRVPKSSESKEIVSPSENG